MGFLQSGGHVLEEGGRGQLFTSPQIHVCVGVYGACGIFQISKWTISSVLVHYNTLQLCGQ